MTSESGNETSAILEQKSADEEDAASVEQLSKEISERLNALARLRSAPQSRFQGSQQKDNDGSSLENEISLHHLGEYLAPLMKELSFPPERETSSQSSLISPQGISARVEDLIVERAARHELRVSSPAVDRLDLRALQNGAVSADDGSHDILEDIGNVRKSPGGKTNMPAGNRGQNRLGFDSETDISIGGGHIQKRIERVALSRSTGKASHSPSSDTDAEWKVNGKAAAGPLAGSSSNQHSQVTKSDSHVVGVEERRPEVESEKSEFQKLCDAQEWSDLARLCDKSLASGAENDLLIRLWWIKANLASGSVPVSILAAPLDSATQDVLGENASIEDYDQELQELALSLLVEAGRALQSSGDRGLAINFLRRANEFTTAASESLLEAVEAELESLSAIPEFRRGTDEDEALRDLGHLQSELRKKGHSSFGKSARKEEAKSEKPRGDIKPEKEEKPSAQSSLLGLSKSSRSSYWIRPIVAVILLFIFVCGVIVYFSSRPELQIAKETLAFSPEEFSGLQPVLERITRFGHLDAIFYDFESRNGRTSSAVKPDKPATKSPQKGEQKTGAANAVKEKIDFSGPIEPASFRQAARQQDAPTAPRQVSKDFVRGFPGQKLEKAPGYPVERFSPPRRYRVLSETEVLSRPSYRAQVVGKLQVDDPVEVSERLGPWLRLVSSLGNSGFILAQDAIENR